MRAGTTGINTTRLYSPSNFGPRPRPQKGRFVRHWLPPWRVPDAWLFEPWRCRPTLQAYCGVQVGVDITCRWSSSTPPPT